MDVLHQPPYINLDYPPSPSSAQINIPDSFDSFDFNPSSPFPHTPSYNGSYQNSPYSASSELSFNGEGEQYSLFDDDPTNYDPSEYDNPNPPSLLMFNDPTDFPSSSYDQTAQVSVSLTPAIDHRSPLDYSSPSSNGGAESGPEGELQQLRSRNSSVSSTHRTSPRLDVAQSLENMRFESPNWGSKPLPVDRPLSPPHKPLSPPQLRIPPSPNANTAFPPPPTINAPSGDGGLMAGPQLHIVPATPVSGGGAQTQPVPFQSRLETLRQGKFLFFHPISERSALSCSLDAALNTQQGSASWNRRSEPITISDESQSSLAVPQFSDQVKVPFAYSHESPAALSGSQLRDGSNTTNDFLFPMPQQRLRSKSDTALQPPQWNTGFMNSSNDHNSALDDSIGTVNMNDVQSSSDTQQSSFVNVNQPFLHHNLHFGPHDASSNFLSPDLGIPLRRSKSDSGSRPGHQRQSRSEDIRSPSFGYPPSSQQDFINRQFLSPQETVPAIRGVHHRRASSGSRGITSGPYAGGGGSWSNSSSQRPSPYPSPNPSPHARYNELPNVALSGRHAPLLHSVDVDPGMGSLLLPDQGQQQQRERMMQGQGQGNGSLTSQITVSKPNVTTGRTANASHKRRKQEANFSCPVPNCGSTFTRSFNLKGVFDSFALYESDWLTRLMQGHMRSHNEEKPFQCHWPGCGKGFARQHDCKRHEQLHTNYRPYTCEGCSKPFARMDALNRHRKSLPIEFSLSLCSSPTSR